MKQKSPEGPPEKITHGSIFSLCQKQAPLATQNLVWAFFCLLLLLFFLGLSVVACKQAVVQNATSRPVLGLYVRMCAVVGLFLLVPRLSLEYGGLEARPTMLACSWCCSATVKFKAREKGLSNVGGNCNLQRLLAWAWLSLNVAFSSEAVRSLQKKNCHFRLKKIPKKESFGHLATVQYIGKLLAGAKQTK